MPDNNLPRREFLKMLAAAFPAAAFDWSSFPVATQTKSQQANWDVIVIGSGLGGLSCAAAFARQGFRPLVIEQHDKQGGFATAFNRPGGFRFDVSLHSTTVGKRDGRYNLVGGFPEIQDVEFLPHPTLFRAIFPEHNMVVQQQNPAAFFEWLSTSFPDERMGIQHLFQEMRGLSDDVARLSRAKGSPDMSRFAQEYPHLSSFHDKTWDQMAGTYLRDAKLKALISAQWPYYGLPPSSLSCFYYALPLLGYLSGGGFYPKGRSDDISGGLARYITSHGGTILLNTKVKTILLKGDSATGVITDDGRTFSSAAVVSNANPFDTFTTMIGNADALAEYKLRWQQYSVSLSAFQVFLGLREDLVGTLGLTDSEIFIEPSYDLEASYIRALKGDVEDGGVAVTLYDNIHRGYSPAGKNTVNILALQGYDRWEKFEKDYFAGRKMEYNREKNSLGELLIRKVEHALLPGLTSAIEVKDISTPLTVKRYTGHHRGAIYGWNQTVNNAGPTRIGHATPIKRLYLAGAWSRPGHGYGAVIPSGLECFAEIMKDWQG